MAPEQDKPLEQMERDEREMQEGVDRLGEKVDEVRSDWRAKQDDDNVPGAEPRDEDDEDTEDDDDTDDTGDTEDDEESPPPEASPPPSDAASEEE